MSADVARSHGGEDRSPPHHVPTGCMGCFANRAHWSSYIGEVIRGVPLYYPSWLKVPKERKAALITDIGTEINTGIQQHFQKAYNTNKAAFKAQHWVIDPTTRTYDVEKIRRHVLRTLRQKSRKSILSFGMIPETLLELLKIGKTGSGTQENPSLIDTFFVAHTVNGEFLQDEDRRIYFESGGANRSGGCGDDKESANAQEDEDEDGDGDS
ncbi:hypothetical protein Tco_1515476 [Tanacetum coccineum]